MATRPSISSLSIVPVGKNGTMAVKDLASNLAEKKRRKPDATMLIVCLWAQKKNNKFILLITIIIIIKWIHPDVGLVGNSAYSLKGVAPLTSGMELRCDIDYPARIESWRESHINSLRGRRNRGRGRGAREARENEEDWGEGRGNACHKNPIRFISAFAGKRKFLIG